MQTVVNTVAADSASESVGNLANKRRYTRLARSSWQLVTCASKRDVFILLIVSEVDALDFVSVWIVKKELWPVARPKVLGIEDRVRS